MKGALVLAGVAGLVALSLRAKPKKYAPPAPAPTPEPLDPPSSSAPSTPSSPSSPKFPIAPGRQITIDASVIKQAFANAQNPGSAWPETGKPSSSQGTQGSPDRAYEKGAGGVSGTLESDVPEPDFWDQK